MRSLKSLFDFNKKRMHESLQACSFLVHDIHYISLLRISHDCPLSPLSGVLMSFRYNITAQIITRAIIKKENS
jgi:hypothetical protein